MITISKPIVFKEEEKEVLSVLRSGMLTQGIRVKKFEEEYAKYIGVRYAVAVSSGTAALHLALLALNIGKGDEVITTPFSFIASTSSIILSGAKPVFADIDPLTFNIDPKEVEKKITKNTKAILLVHLFGLPCDMRAILQIAKKHKLLIIEDACQAHGAKIGKEKVGAFGDMGCFSFYPTKNMFAGEGGIITTNSLKTAKKLRLLRSHGSKKQYEHTIIGFNYRMTDISASIGIVQLKRLERSNEKRISNAKYLSDRLKHISEIVVPFVPAGYTHVFHQFSILVNFRTKHANKKLQIFLHKLGIESEIYYPIPIHMQKAVRRIFTDKKRLKFSENISQKILSLPIHPGLTTRDLDRIVKGIKSYYEKNS